MTNVQHLIDALVHEHEFLTHDDAADAMSAADYRDMLESYTLQDLIDEADTDNLDDYITNWL